MASNIARMTSIFNLNESFTPINESTVTPAVKGRFIEEFSDFALPQFNRYSLADESAVRKAINDYSTITNPSDKQLLAETVMMVNQQLGYNIQINENHPIHEAVGDNLFNTLTQYGKQFELASKWLDYTKTKGKRKATITNVSNEDFTEIMTLVSAMRNAQTYEEYLPLFKSFCKYFNIPHNGTLVCSDDIIVERTNGYKLTVQYTNNNYKITLPEGFRLYHISRVPNLTHLKPTFKGRPDVTGYLYSTPRVYLTIAKYTPRIISDNTDIPYSKLYRYITKEDIRDCYVDPLVWSPNFGAVYVEGDKDIPVEPA